MAASRPISKTAAGVATCQTRNTSNFVRAVQSVPGALLRMLRFVSKFKVLPVASVIAGQGIFVDTRYRTPSFSGCMEGSRAANLPGSPPRPMHLSPLTQPHSPMSLWDFQSPASRFESRQPPPDPFRGRASILQDLFAKAREQQFPLREDLSNLMENLEVDGGLLLAVFGVLAHLVTSTHMLTYASEGVAHSKSTFP
jgi:hypothetical protein